MDQEYEDKLKIGEEDTCSTPIRRVARPRAIEYMKIGIGINIQNITKDNKDVLGQTKHTCGCTFTKVMNSPEILL